MRWLQIRVGIRLPDRQMEPAVRPAELARSAAAVVPEVREAQLEAAATDRLDLRG
jgi:hypothetical protein